MASTKGLNRCKWQPTIIGFRRGWKALFIFTLYFMKTATVWMVYFRRTEQISKRSVKSKFTIPIRALRNKALSKLLGLSAINVVTKSKWWSSLLNRLHKLLQSDQGAQSLIFSWKFHWAYACRASVTQQRQKNDKIVSVPVFVLPKWTGCNDITTHSSKSNADYVYSG